MQNIKFPQFLTFLPFAHYHSITDKKEEKTGLIAKLGLDDWKFALPMGLFVGIPALSNEVNIFESLEQLKVDRFA
jgi:hypothetical protein